MYTVICIIIDHLKMLKHFFFRNWQMTYSLPYLLYVPEKSPKKLFYQKSIYCIPRIAEDKE